MIQNVKFREHVPHEVNGTSRGEQFAQNGRKISSILIQRGGIDTVHWIEEQNKCRVREFVK